MIAAPAAPALSQGAKGRALSFGTQEGPGYGGLSGPTYSDQICLKHKRTGKRICKDRLGWEREAARLSAATQTNGRRP
ncbi:hypothetical protein [Sphingomonas jatrophae]|nr:hypothetical protein [Sphingomonas jatrophae]